MPTKAFLPTAIAIDDHYSMLKARQKWMDNATQFEKEFYWRQQEYYKNQTIRNKIEKDSLYARITNGKYLFDLNTPYGPKNRCTEYWDWSKVLVIQTIVSIWNVILI